MATIVEETVIKLAINPMIRPSLLALFHDGESCEFALLGEAGVLTADCKGVVDAVEVLTAGCKVVVVVGANVTIILTPYSKKLPEIYVILKLVPSWQ